MPLKEHLENTFKLTPSSTPIPRMVLCSLCTTLPLILGFVLNQLPLAIFGGLFGFVLILNDHFGPLRQRINHLAITFLLLSLSFYLGAILANNNLMTALALFIISFILGKAKNFGIELERLLLFMALQILTAAGSPGIKDFFWSIMLYFTLAFLNYIICLTLIYYFFRHASEFMASKRETFKKIINQKETNRFAIVFALTTTLGFILANILHISRGYWVVGTTLIVMLPNSTQSIYKSAQRLVGTFVGVLLAAFCLHFGHDPISLILFVLVAAYFAPLGLTRNYWLGNIFIAALILFLLEISSGKNTDSIDLAKLRTIDIGLGCLLGIIGSFINDPSFLKKFKKKPKALLITI
ncbi:MAG: FUSC family protein [Bacteriovorax sp.]|nr:FUSC family protein [Bacteriovorax sp.]